jgi:hemerythrin superfamily protein
MQRGNGPANKRPSTRQVKRAAGITEPQNAIALLKADHREVEALFRAFKKSKSESEKQALAKQICDALKVHTRIEEEVFYPAYLEATGDEELRNEAVVEHQAAKKLIEEIESSVAGDPLFDARITVLAEMIKHHVKEEESLLGGMFPKARAAGMDLRALGILLEARKQELVAEPSKRRSKTPPKTRTNFVNAEALARTSRRKTSDRGASRV